MERRGSPEGTDVAVAARLPEAARVLERRFSSGAAVLDVPLISLYGATNEVPNDDNLAAIFDRFLLRVKSENLDSYHFHDLVGRGIGNELRKLTFAQDQIRPLLSAADL